MNAQNQNINYSTPTPIVNDDRKWPANTINQCPAFCAVDLRDGNQALPNPMSPEQKLVYFKMLCDIGFKEIEIS